MARTRGGIYADRLAAKGLAQTGTTIPADLFVALKERAAAEDRTISSWLRILIRQALEDQTSP